MASIIVIVCFVSLFIVVVDSNRFHGLFIIIIIMIERLKDTKVFTYRIQLQNMNWIADFRCY